MIETIYEDDELIVSHCANDSDIAVLSFSPMNHDIVAKGIPALAALRAAGLGVFGVMARRNNWYPSKNMYAAAHRLQRVLARYRHRISYGSSMGAYAALKYSAMLHCGHVLALAPQFSIDPGDVGSWDNRFTRHFNPDRHKRMQISPGDLGGAGDDRGGPNHARRLTPCFVDSGRSQLSQTGRTGTCMALWAYRDQPHRFAQDA